MGWQAIESAEEKKATAEKILCWLPGWEPHFRVWKTNMRIMRMRKTAPEHVNDMVDSYWGDPDEMDDYDMAKPDGFPTHWFPVDPVPEHAEVMMIAVTENQDDERGKKLFAFRRYYRNPPMGFDTFEVFQTDASDGLPYVGYFNGERSVTADRGDVAARALQRKHIVGLPEGVLINFNEAVKALGEKR